MRKIILCLALLAGCVKHELGKIKSKRYVPAHNHTIWTWDVVMDMPKQKTISHPDSWILIVQPEHRVQYECQVTKEAYNKLEIGSIFYCD